MEIKFQGGVTVRLEDDCGLTVVDSPVQRAARRRRLATSLSQALAPKFLNCDEHGSQLWVPTCLCVLDEVEGRPAAQATTDAVLCARHLQLAELDDPRADDDVVPVCLRCLTQRGLLP